jgi:DTW domain-containing protein YfiP
MARETCYRCHKPRATCVCATTPRVANRTEIVVLQHARERFHPIGTARFAALGLERARVELDDQRDPEGTRARLALGPRAGLLFPRPGAIPLEALAPDARPDQLVLLDGTWPQARGLYRRHRWLAELPHYALQPPAPSVYRIRAEPFREAVSTIEASVLALSALEPERRGALDALLGAFVQMIDAQIVLGERRVGRIRKRRPPPPSRAVPPELARDVVLVFGELAPTTHPGERRPLLSWTALRLADDARFERFVHVDPPPSDRQLDHMRVTRAHFEAAVLPDALRAAWRAFVRDDDVLVAWNASTLEALAEHLGGAPSTVLLKGVYANARRRREASGSLSEIVAREGLTTRPVAVEGRAGRVLAELRAVVEALRPGVGSTPNSP